MATYLGARAIRVQNGRLRIVQGNLDLEVCILKTSGNSLKAPAKGNMTRTICESVSGTVFYRFRKMEKFFLTLKQRVLLSNTSIHSERDILVMLEDRKI